MQKHFINSNILQATQLKTGTHQTHSSPALSGQVADERKQRLELDADQVMIKMEIKCSVRLPLAGYKSLPNLYLVTLT